MNCLTQCYEIFSWWSSMINTFVFCKRPSNFWKFFQLIFQNNCHLLTTPLKWQNQVWPTSLDKYALEFCCILFVPMYVCSFYWYSLQSSPPCLENISRGSETFFLLVHIHPDMWGDDNWCVWCVIYQNF
jgi:hypothetical protein